MSNENDAMILAAFIDAHEEWPTYSFVTPETSCVYSTVGLVKTLEGIFSSEPGTEASASSNGTVVHIPHTRPRIDPHAAYEAQQRDYSRQQVNRFDNWAKNACGKITYTSGIQYNLLKEPSNFSSLDKNEQRSFAKKCMDEIRNYMLYAGLISASTFVIHANASLTFRQRMWEAVENNNKGAREHEEVTLSLYYPGKPLSWNPEKYEPSKEDALCFLHGFADDIQGIPYEGGRRAYAAKKFSDQFYSFMKIHKFSSADLAQFGTQRLQEIYSGQSVTLMPQKEYEIMMVLRPLLSRKTERRKNINCTMLSDLKNPWSPGTVNPYISATSGFPGEEKILAFRTGYEPTDEDRYSGFASKTAQQIEVKPFSSLKKGDNIVSKETRYHAEYYSGNFVATEIEEITKSSKEPVYRIEFETPMKPGYVPLPLLGGRKNKNTTSLSASESQLLWTSLGWRSPKQMEWHMSAYNILSSQNLSLVYPGSWGLPIKSVKKASNNAVVYNVVIKGSMDKVRVTNSYEEKGLPDTFVVNGTLARSYRPQGMRKIYYNLTH